MEPLTEAQKEQQKLIKEQEKEAKKLQKQGKDTFGNPAVVAATDRPSGTKQENTDGNNPGEVPVANVKTPTLPASSLQVAESQELNLGLPSPEQIAAAEPEPDEDETIVVYEPVKDGNGIIIGWESKEVPLSEFKAHPKREQTGLVAHRYGTEDPTLTAHP
jgi:hypothetical protein